MDSLLSVYYQNCRGLRTKLDTLYMNVLSMNYDIIIFSETWFYEGIGDNECIDPRYTVFRGDRDRHGSQKKDGGGVLIAVRRELGATEFRARPRAAGGRARRPALAAPLGTDAAAALASCATASSASSQIEHVMIEFPADKGMRYVISAVYIPSNSPAELYEYHFNVLYNTLNCSSIKHFWLTGDYNLPELRWDIKGTLCTPIITPQMSTASKYLTDFMSIFNCSQLNSNENVCGNILDLFLTDSNDCSCTVSPIPLSKVDIYHPPLFATISLQTSYIKHKPQLKFCFYPPATDYSSINSEFKQVNWTVLFGELPAESAVDVFYDKLNWIIKKYVPMKNKKYNTNFPNWFSPALIHIFKNKNKAWLRWKTYQNVSDYNTFSLLRERFKEQCRVCYKAYIESVESSIKDNVKYFWTYIANRKISSDIPNTVIYQGETAQKPTDVCNLFSNFFHSVYEPSEMTDDFDADVLDNPNSDLNLSSIYINQQNVLKALRKVDISKGAGRDNIPPIFIKNTAEELAFPLFILFNRCIKEGVFPNIWKRANVVPVHKSGPKKDVEKYRPISILPTFSKLFERLVHDEIYPSLHKIIIPQQHGFVKKRSTVTNLLEFTSYLFKNMDKNKQVDCIYTDYRKAFDVVDHKLLLEKLAFNGIRGSLWRWFKSYILNRTQTVVIKGFESNNNHKFISSGVPQGSILGPLLFVIFINDVHTCFKYCNFLLYADDLKIYHTIEDLNDYIFFQRDLDTFHNYCTANKLQLSINKCKSISYTKKIYPLSFKYMLHFSILDRTSCIRDLGVLFDSKLHFDTHIENIINRSFRMYGFVMRSATEFKSASTFLHLYKSLIRSQLEYATPIWNPFFKKYKDSIEMVQKRFLRSVQYKIFKNKIHYTDLLKKFNVLDLQSRRTYLDISLLFDICHHRYDCINLTNMLSYKIPFRTIHRSGRHHRLFATTSCRTIAGERSPLVRMVIEYNSNFHEIDIITLSSGVFRTQVRSTLLEHSKIN